MEMVDSSQAGCSSGFSSFGRGLLISTSILWSGEVSCAKVRGMGARNFLIWIK
jgi:hypothetical protein